MIPKSLNKVSIYVLTPILFLIILLFLSLQTYLISIPKIIESEKMQAKENLLEISLRTQMSVNNILNMKQHATPIKEFRDLFMHDKKINLSVLLNNDYEIKYISDKKYKKNVKKCLESIVNDKNYKDRDISKPYIVEAKTPYQFHSLIPLSTNSQVQNGYFVLEYDYSGDVEQSKELIGNLFIISLLLATFLFVIFIFILYHAIIHKIELLQKASEKIKDGEYGVQIGNNSFKEVGNIINSFNQMSSKIAEDIMKIKTTKKELRYEKETAQTYLDIVGVMVLVLDKNYNVLLINREGCRIIGYEQDEVIGKNWMNNFLPERFRKKVTGVGDSLTKREKEKIKHFENPVLTKSGEERMIAWRNSSLLDKDGNIIGVLTSGEDVTQEREVQMALQKSEYFYRSIFDSVHEAIFILDDSTIVDCNDLSLKLFNMDKDEFIGINILENDQLIKCLDTTFQTWLILAHNGEHLTYQCTINSSGSKAKIVSLTLSKFGEDDNKVICVAHDITEKLEQEKFLKQHTRQAQMGEMISMIAHQWRQPLGIISAITANLIIKQMLDDNKDQYLINQFGNIEKQVKHLSDTINDFRDFFKPNKEKETINLYQALKDSTTLLEQSIKSNDIEIIYRVENDAELQTYRNELNQVLMSIIKNSMDAFVENKIDNNRKIEFTVDKNEIYALLSIKDNAGGISPEIIDDIFLPYFSTKDKHNGTGIGLYMCSTVIKEHCNGEFDVSSSQGETIFRISLPL